MWVMRCQLWHWQCLLCCMIVSSNWARSCCCAECLVSHAVCMMYQPCFFFPHVMAVEGPLCLHTACICSAAFTAVVQHSVCSEAFTSLLQFCFASHQLAVCWSLHLSEREREFTMLQFHMVLSQNLSQKRMSLYSHSHCDQK